MPFIADLQLTITPTYALYTEIVLDSQIVVDEDITQGRSAIILDLSGASTPTVGQGLYSRDIGTIFSWPVGVPTILNVWQPSIIPLHEDIYQRLSFNFLSTSLGGVGWQHIRELNFAFSSVSDIDLSLTFGAEAVPSALGVVIPNSGGVVTKVKVLIPANKWKVVSGYLSSPNPFFLWVNDMELMCRSWGSADGYRVVKPFAS